MMDFSRSRFDIIARSKMWYLISSIFIILGLIGIIKNLATTGFPLVLGIDFTGGSIIQLQFNNWDQSRDNADFTHEIVTLVDNYTERTPQVLATDLDATETGTGNPGLLIQIRADTGLLENSDAQSSLYDEIRASGGDFEVIEETEVGAVIGSELAQKALQGVIIGLILILIYITIRLSFDFAVFAVVALFHDVLILIGVYALFGIEVNSPFVAILLTVVGYSINDTIVIYDRIRENMKVKRHLSFDRIVNQSLLETMARSINTSFTTLLAIVALLIFGGVSLRTFMLGLGVGVLTGTYSSIFVASTLLVSWRLKDKTKPVAVSPGSDVTQIIRESEDDLLDLSTEPEKTPEEIRIDKPPSVAKEKRKKPKRRRRRH